MPGAESHWPDHTEAPRAGQASSNRSAYFVLAGVVLGGVIGLTATVWSTQAQIRHTERSQVRLERIEAYHDYLVAHERVLADLRELRDLVKPAEDAAAPPDPPPSTRHALEEQAMKNQFELTVAADKLYLVGSVEAGEAAVELVDALSELLFASISTDEDAPDQVRRAQLRHHAAVAEFQSVARGDIGND